MATGFGKHAQRCSKAALGWVELCSLLALGAGSASCSQQLPECPPGTAFDDCTVSGSASPLMPTALAQGGSGGAASGAGGSPASTGIGASAAGSSPETPPVMQGAPVAMQMPVAVTPAPVAMDRCADDPLKTLPGACGCGVPDDDLDGDGAFDCMEACPDNAGRTAPMGACGCSNLTDVAGCTALGDALRNLYTFNGTGLQIIDSVSARNGVVADAVGMTAPAALAQLQQNGRLNLDGRGPFVQLPAGLISDLTNATFELWVSWRGGAAWARMFDFGNNNGATPTLGQTYLFLTPANSENGNLRIAYSVAGGGNAETVLDGLMPLPMAGAQDRTLQHVAVVIDDVAGAMRLFANGAQVGTVAFTGGLAQIQDVNNWLGRSNYSVDPALFGSLIEFRIYDQALTAAQIGLSYRAGPGSLG